MSRPDELREEDHQQLKALLAFSPELKAAVGHVRTFAAIMTDRTGERLSHWIAHPAAR